MYKLFQSDFFHFEFLRVLGSAVFQGAESGECLVARAQMQDGNPETWYHAWTEQAEKAIALAEEARACDDRVGAAWAYLRAANYYRASEFFLHCNPEDPRLLAATTNSIRTFDIGAQYLDCEVRVFDIPYEDGASLPARLFLPASRGSHKLPLIIQTGGFDSTQEELYFYGPAGAVPRGNAVLTFEGPGQGIVLRRDGLRLRPDWERVTGKVLDFVEERLAAPYALDTEKIAVMGASLGGYFALRAAADTRVRACISCDGCYDLFDITRSRMPSWFINGWLNGWLSDGFFNTVVRCLSATNFQLRWEFGHSQWVYGVHTPADVMRMMQKFSLKGAKGEEYLSQLQCSTLVTGAGDTIYFTPDLNAERIFDRLGHIPDNRKQLWIGKGADGGGLQAKIGSMAVMHQKMFSWLDEQFGK